MLLRGEGRQGEVVAASVLGGIEAVHQVEAAWEALCQGASWDAPFFRPGWIKAHLEAFEPGARIRLVTASRGGRLIGLLPLVEEIAWWRGIPHRRLRGASGVHSCRFDLLLADGEEEEAAEQIWRHLAELPGWHVLELRDVPFGGAGERLLAAADGEGHHVATWESMRTPTIPLQGHADMDALLGSLGSKFRSNLRRRRKRLKEQGALALRRIDVADPQVLERFYELEAAGWKGRRGSAIAASSETRRFYDLAARWAASEGMLALYVLERDGEAVAMHWGLSHGGRYYLPKPAYDEAHKSCSPGQLIVEDVLRDCFARGLREFDFLGPSMEWKRDWTQSVLPHRWCYVHRQGPLGRALFWGKFRLGPWIERLREGGGREKWKPS